MDRKVYVILSITVLIVIATYFFSSTLMSDSKPQELSLKAEFTKDVYIIGESIMAEIEIYNPGESKEGIWLGFSIQDPMGVWIDIEPKELNLPKKDKVLVNMDIKAQGITGPYSAVFALWDSYPVDETSIRIKDIHIPNGIRIYSTQDSFKELDHSIWIKRDGSLGRSQLQQNNVIIDDKGLKIKLPANTLNGGEIQTRKELSFGSYEVEMKLPNAPSSITGFFLYKEPDFYHEIDIEIYNEPNAYILFTTYKDGRVYNEYKEFLDFDPTENYHRYRFDYYPNEVAFYIDDEFINSWDRGFSHEPMRLMLNAWFPRWLDGIAPIEDQYLKVNWIRY